MTEDTGTQGLGRWQLEGFSDAEKSVTTGERTMANAFALSYGFHEAIDYQLGVPWFRDGADGVGDISLGVKWRFFERESLSLGLKPDVTLPTGKERDGRGTGRVTWGALIIASYETGPIAVHAHAGYRHNGNKLGERKDLDSYAAAFTYRIGRVRLVSEVARETNPEPGGRAERFVTLGAIWSVTRDFDLDLGWRQGHGGSDLDDAWLLGATVRW